jgi:hypothetical protein
MDQLLLSLVTIIHFLVIIFVVITPFFGNNYVLLVHSIVVPFIILHWAYNDDSCFLTTIELSLRRRLYGRPVDKNDCLTCRIMSPIYNVTTQHEEYSRSIYIITLLLWSVSFSKLVVKYKGGEIKGILDLIVPKGNLYQFSNY